MQRIHTLGPASLAALMAAQRHTDRPSGPAIPGDVTDGNGRTKMQANGALRPNLCPTRTEDHPMRQTRRHLLALGAAGVLATPLLARRAAAQTATSTRIRGAIAAVTADSISVKTNAGDTVAIGIDAKTPIVGVSAATLADIKPGSFVGSAAKTQPDGTMVAWEVHIFPESLRGTGEGHRPMDPQNTMTNGTVGADMASVGGVSGRTITINYAGGQKKILVPDGVPIVTYDLGTRALLVPGAHISVMATEPAGGGPLTATRLTVGKAGVTPPI